MRRTVRMIQRRLELHFRRHVRVVRRKRETSAEETTYYSPLVSKRALEEDVKMLIQAFSHPNFTHRRTT